MYDPGRRNTCHRELHRTLKRICGGAVAANLVVIGTPPCVHIRTQGRPGDFTHSILANPSDTVSAVKAKFLSIVGCQSRLHVLHFHVAGQELPDYSSLAECGVMPNDTIDITFDVGTMQICMKTFTVTLCTVTAESSDSIGYLKIKVWLCTGLFPHDTRLVFAGLNMEDDRTLGDCNIRDGSTVYVLQRNL